MRRPGRARRVDLIVVILALNPLLSLRSRFRPGTCRRGTGSNCGVLPVVQRWGGRDSCGPYDDGRTVHAAGNWWTRPSARICSPGTARDHHGRGLCGPAIDERRESVWIFHRWRSHSREQRPGGDMEIVRGRANYDGECRRHLFDCDAHGGIFRNVAGEVWIARIYILTGSDLPKDSVTLSADGTRVSGEDQYGLAISGVKTQPCNLNYPVETDFG